MKNLFLGRVSQKTNIEGELNKRGSWTICRFKGELGKKVGLVILMGGGGGRGGRVKPQCTLW